MEGSIKQILHKEICDLFKGTATKIYLSKVDQNYGQGLFINVVSDGIRYDHTGSQYYTKSELIVIEIGVHLVKEYEAILNKAVEAIVGLTLTNENILESLLDAPEINVKPSDLDDFGETNLYRTEIHIKVDQQAIFNPVHLHEFINLHMEVKHEGEIVHEEDIINTI